MIEMLPWLMLGQNSPQPLSRSESSTTYNPFFKRQFFVSLLDANLRVVRCNDAFFRTFEVTEQETIGSRVYDLGNGQWNIPAFRQLLEDVLPNKTTVKDYEVSHGFPKLGPKIMRLNAHQLRLAGSDAELILLAIEDVTIAELAKREVAEQHELLRVTISCIGDAVITTDSDCRVITMNLIAEELTGWHSSNATGMALVDIFNIINQDTRQAVPNPLEKALREGVVVGLANHTILISKSGKEFSIDDSAAPIKNREGKIVGGVLIFRDITERRRVENDCTRLASIVENSADLIGATDLRGNPIYLNSAGRKLVGLVEEGELSRDIVRELFVESEQGRIDQEILPAIKNEGRWTGETRLKHVVFGEEIPVLFDVFLVVDPKSSRPINYATVAHDISNQKQATGQLQQVSEFNRSLMDGSVDCVKVLDLEGRLMQMNAPGMCVMEVDDFSIFCGRSWESLWPEDTRQEISIAVASAKSGIAYTFEAFCPTAKGSPRWWHVTVSPVRNSPDGPVVRLLSISRDISEQRRIDQQLAQTFVTLSEADQRKNEFLAMLAHELRNPLAPVRNGLSIIKMAGGNLEMIEKATILMDRQVHHMVRLVDDLLDVSRINSGKIELRLTEIDVRSAISHATDASQSMVESASHQLSIELPDEPVVVRADAVRLTQVFGNLINNACKYSEACGKIHIAASVEYGFAVVSFKDAGLGIEESMLTKVFDLFAQVDVSLRRSQGGLGIGLSLVRSIVELHGGSVIAKSGGLGLGSEFIVKLPLATEVQASKLETDVESQSLERYRILVVDDNRDSAVTLAMLLKMSGHQTHKAFDGEQAYELASTFKPDVVLLDLGLPKLDGFQVAQMIRQQSWGTSIVLIALTGWGQDEDRRKSKESGFDGHLVKPVDTNALTEMLSSLTDLKRSKMN